MYHPMKGPVFQPGRHTLRHQALLPTPLDLLSAPIAHHFVIGGACRDVASNVLLFKPPCGVQLRCARDGPWASERIWVARIAGNRRRLPVSRYQWVRVGGGQLPGFGPICQVSIGKEHDGHNVLCGHPDGLDGHESSRMGSRRQSLESRLRHVVQRGRCLVALLGFSGQSRRAPR